ncbi:hypothetical protein P4O66_018099 [Electrophorus voltai]|uniref:TNFR-Cys domain-containing protein n=1 Tax=Electrophorus voltai TaxID=2609070 RepID=A0AAD8YVG1_9TELE|nr:hypothetical protein P4O66_018099 [Electrophorus voltai]
MASKMGRARPMAPGMRCLHLKILFLHLCLVAIVAEERRACKEQEYRHQDGNCVACRQCDAGQELSKECGFGFGEEAHCVPCRAGRFKPDGGLQKCKPCLHCTMLHRLQKANCSSTRNAVCGDCLPGFYRKTKLSGFQDMECIPCGDPPPPYEPHCKSRHVIYKCLCCFGTYLTPGADLKYVYTAVAGHLGGRLDHRQSGRVNLVPVPSTVTSPRDMALAAVICGALATVLLALVVLCIIYCKRQLLEKKPSKEPSPTPHTAEVQIPRQQARPMQLIPSLCCEDLYRESHKHSPFQSLRSLSGSSCQPGDLLSPGCYPVLGDYSEKPASCSSHVCLTACIYHRHVTPSPGSSRCDVRQDLPAGFSDARPLMAHATDRNEPEPQRCGPPSAERSSLKKEQEEEVDHGSGLLRSEAVLATPDGDATTEGKSPQNDEIHLCQFCTPLTPLEVQRWCRSFEGWAALINVSESSRLTGFERRVECENS